MIELLVTIAIAAVMVSIAAPSFSVMVASKRGKDLASELFATLARTRSEAIATNSEITLSPKGNSWQNGWQLLNSTNAVLDDHAAVVGVTIAGPTSVIYRASGRVKGSAAPTAFVITSTSGSVTSYQCVSVALTGRPYIKAANSC